MLEAFAVVAACLAQPAKAPRLAVAVADLDFVAAASAGARFTNALA